MAFSVNGQDPAVVDLSPATIRPAPFDPGDLSFSHGCVDPALIGPSLSADSK